MDAVNFKLLPSPAQFKWLADQLRAVRSIRDMMTGQSGVNPFGSPLKSLEVLTKGASAALTSYVNAGMQGFSSSTLSEDVWKTQFQYRPTGGAGIVQFDGGDLYIPAMAPNQRLKVADGFVLDLYRVSSAIFRIQPASFNGTVPACWTVQLFRNERPARKSPTKKGV